MKWHYHCWKENIDFCPGISLNNFTEELTIVIDAEWSGEICLSLNNLLTANIPSFQKLELHLYGKKIDHSMISSMISPGLSNNRTLKELTVTSLRHLKLTNPFISSIVSSAAKNPNLKSIHVRSYTRVSVGDLSPEAIKTLLSVSTPLSKLSLCCKNSEFIFEGFKNKLSLKRVDVHDGNLMFFLIPLSIWPQLMTKVKRDKPEKDQASDIYYFLKGPALAARTSFGKTLD